MIQLHRAITASWPKEKQGVAVRKLWNETVSEPVPSDMLALLSKLK